MSRLKRVSDEQIIEAINKNPDPKQRSEVARSLGIAERTLRERVKKLKDSGALGDDEAEPSFKMVTDKNTADVVIVGSLKECEQMMLENIDLDVWVVKKKIHNVWGNRKDNDCRQVKLWLERRFTPEDEEGTNILIKRMEEHAPKYKPRKYKPIQDAHCLEISLADHHFGKLCWDRETGQNYDLGIARDIYLNAGTRLLNLTSGFKIERFLLPMCGDFFHVDSMLNETTSGTRQDVDSRYAKMLDVGQIACVNLIDELLTHAPVDVVCVSGNHDLTSHLHLSRTLAAWYRNDKHVNVDCGPRLRKYYVYGCCMLGYTHGNNEKHADLPLIMAGEMPEEWASTSVHEWHIGHLHKRKTTTFGEDTFGPVSVRIMPSMCATDYWHHSKGYVNQPRAALAMLWNKETGYTGEFSVDVNQVS